MAFATPPVLQAKDGVYNLDKFLNLIQDKAAEFGSEQAGYVFARKLDAFLRTPGNCKKFDEKTNLITLSEKQKQDFLSFAREVLDADYPNLSPGVRDKACTEIGKLLDSKDVKVK